MRRLKQQRFWARGKIKLKSSWLLIFLQIERSLLSLCCENQDKHSSHVRSTGQRYNKIWELAIFVCGKTWLCPKRLPGESYSMHSLHARKLVANGRLLLPLHDAGSVGHEQHALQPLVLAGVSVRAFHQVARARACNINNFVQFSVRNLTLWVPFLCTNHSPCRKKTILAKVCFDVKWGKFAIAAKWIFIYNSRRLYPFLGYFLLNAVRFGAKCVAFWR